MNNKFWLNGMLIIIPEKVIEGIKKWVFNFFNLLLVFISSNVNTARITSDIDKDNSFIISLSSTLI